MKRLNNETESKNRKQTKSGGKVMKTIKTNRNRIQQSILKAAIVAVVIILSANVNGQSYWAANTSAYYKFIEAMVSTTPNDAAKLVINGDAAMFENETEERLEVKNWMTENEYFDVNYGYEQEADSPLQLEDWMTSESYFELATEKDNPLKVEPWMTATNFGRK